MIVACPSCAAKYKVDETKLDPKGVKLKCTKCQTIFPVMPVEAVPAPAPAPVAAPPPKAPAPQSPAPSPSAGKSSATVLVAHDSYSFCRRAEEVLKGSGHKVFVTHEAEETLEICKVEALDILIVDVMLPGMLGFELASKLKEDPGTNYIKIMLAVSIFDPTAYKRSPSQMHGADDVIEAHHIEDQLLEKVNRLLGNAPGDSQAAPASAPAPRPAAPPAAPSTPAAPPPASAPAPAAAAAPAAGDGSSPDHQKAQRLARTIVSDIALYNHDRILEGLKKGNLYDLLKKDITEGTDLYNKRVSEEIRKVTNYLTDELNSLFERKRREAGL